MLFPKYINWACIACFFLILSPLSSFSQNLERVKRTIDTLCSESMHGRGYVQAGDKIAANYISKQFARLRLRSFSEEYYQRFRFDINTFPNKVQVRLNKTSLVPGQDFIVNAISQAGKGKAKLVPLDSLIFSDRNYQARFLTKNIAKVVMVLKTKDFARILDLEQNLIDKIYEAKALIELKETKLVAAMSTRQLSKPFFEIPRALYDSIIDPDAKSNTIKFRLDAKILKGYESQNVIGFVPGRTEPDSFIVFSAHYDHLGRLGKKAYFPGANDNASGVSMLLELAHYYAQPENQLDYSVVFMAFSGEEVGLLGSRYYVNNPFFPLEQIKFLLNVDLVGTGDDGATVVNGSVFKKEFEQLMAINQEKNYLPKINPRGFAANSDHYFFTEKGVRSFFLYTLGGITAYHDIYDRAETLPLTRYTGVFNLIKDFIRSL